MKNLYFALLACLLTACFRAPQLSTSPQSAPAHPNEKTAGPFSPDREGYAWSGAVAAAGSAHGVTGMPPEAAAATATPPTTRISTGADGNPQSIARPLSTRRVVRKAVRKVLAEGRLAARAQQDDPVAPRRSGLALASLLAGIGGLLLFVLGVAASGSVSGISVLFFLLSFLTGILAVVFGAVARGKIRDGLAPKTDRGRATAGFILGIVNMSIFVLLTLLFVAIIVAWSGSFYTRSIESRQIQRARLLNRALC